MESARIHHINCGCMCPVGGKLFDGNSSGLYAHLPCHCLLLETEKGLILIDTGFGEKDIANPRARISPFFLHLNRIQFDANYTAIAQIKKLGFSPADVQHIILTHLDFDHAGGIEDFPQATVHVMQSEKDATQNKKRFIAKKRYQNQQWDDVKKWQFYLEDGEEWFNLKGINLLLGLDDLLYVPLAGHTLGHAGIAINTEKGWLLHAGDAYFYHKEIKSLKRICPLGVRFYQWMMEANRHLRLMNQDKLRTLYQENSKELDIFCSHDMSEFHH
ncbi:Zn-dependent hydrolase GumP [Legionella beliardensis]|uniref:Zn-dependent hydrolase GumP n=1 Tax=Legionella beliardensis TaxID=91822 RepID=A0A378I4U7_9GAMM|nr:MBL fold metallo-hydrolase [Legionella beliardensis]STX29716.1 Zn-dependent hydrolase GumP [Legionella beliardensis]